MVAVTGFVQAQSFVRVQSWVATERDRLPLWLPVFMGTGILCYFALRAEPPAWLGAAVAIPAVFAAMLLGSRPVLRAGMMALAAATIGLASAQFATWRAPPLDILPTHATILTGTVRSVEALPEGRRITLEPAQLDDAPPLSRWLRVRLRANDQADVAAGDTIRAARIGASAGAPSLSGCMGSPARCLVQWARRLRLCAWSSGTPRRNGTDRAATTGAATARADRTPHHRGGARPSGAISVTLLTGGDDRHPTGRPRRVPSVGTRPPVGRGGVAHRHRHGLGAGLLPPGVRSLGARQPALAHQEARRPDRTDRRRWLHGADRSSIGVVGAVLILLN